MLETSSPLPSRHAWLGSPPESSPRDVEDDRLTLSHLTERRALSGTCWRRQPAAQVSPAAGTYLCRPPPHPGGRWLPTPAKWPSARSPKRPASPWRPGAGRRQPPPSACLQAESKGREEDKQAVTVKEMQTCKWKQGSVWGEWVVIL